MTWPSFNYCEVFGQQFTPDECERIIGMHESLSGQTSVMPGVRDCGIFWVPPSTETAWVFDRIRGVVDAYNEIYGFELDERMGALQLTRYTKGQRYDWHMDLGAGPMSLRKISVSVELTAAGRYERGGVEVFYGDTLFHAPLRQGDMLLFPSFIMHRALPVRNGVRWSLVSWLTGTRSLS